MNTNTMTSRQLEIIAVAGKILSKSGVSGLTTKNLSKEMNFSESALYRHFKSKQDIIIALIEYLAENMDLRYEPISKMDLSADEKFRKLFESQFAHFKKYPYFVVSVFSDGLMEESGHINEVIEKIMKVKLKYLMPIVKVGQKEGVFTKDIAAEEIAHVVMGTFRLLMFKWKISNFSFDIEQVGGKSIDTLLTLITKK